MEILRFRTSKASWPFLRPQVGLGIFFYWTAVKNKINPYIALKKIKQLIGQFSMIVIIVLIVIFSIASFILASLPEQTTPYDKLPEEEKKRLAKKTIEEYRIVVENLRKQEKEVKEKRQEELLNETIDIIDTVSFANNILISLVYRQNGTYGILEHLAHTPPINSKIRIQKKILENVEWENFSAIDNLKLRFRELRLKRQKEIEQGNEQRKFLHDLQIEYLFHMTHRSNLESILKHGILSHNQARLDGKMQHDLSDQQVNERRFKKEPIFNRSIHDYTPLYFNPKNPMLFKRKEQQNDIVILAIDHLNLYNPNVVFTDGNASANSTIFFSNPKDLTKLDWKCIRSDFWNDFLDGKRIKCAEILVFPLVPPQAIRKVICNSLKSKRMIEWIFFKESNIKIEVNPNFFFAIGGKSTKQKFDDLMADLKNPNIDNLPF